MLSRSMPALARRRPPFASFYTAVCNRLNSVSGSQKMQAAAILWRRTSPHYGISYSAPRVAAALQIYRRDQSNVTKELQAAVRQSSQRKAVARRRSAPARTTAVKRKAIRVSRSAKPRAVPSYAAFRTAVMQRAKLPATEATRNRVQRIWALTRQQRSLSAPKRVDMAVRLLKKEQQRHKKSSPLAAKRKRHATRRARPAARKSVAAKAKKAAASPRRPRRALRMRPTRVRKAAGMTQRPRRVRKAAAKRPQRVAKPAAPAATAQRRRRPTPAKKPLRMRLSRTRAIKATPQSPRRVRRTPVKRSRPARKVAAKARKPRAVRRTVAKGRTALKAKSRPQRKVAAKRATRKPTAAAAAKRRTVRKSGVVARNAVSAKPTKVTRTRKAATRKSAAKPGARRSAVTRTAAAQRRRRQNRYIHFYRQMRMTGLIPNHPKKAGTRIIKALWNDTHNITDLNKRMARATELLEQRTKSKAMVQPAPAPPSIRKSSGGGSAAERPAASPAEFKMNDIIVPKNYEQSPFNATYSALLPMMKNMSAPTRMTHFAKAWTQTNVRDDRRSAKARITAVAQAIKREAQ